MFSFFRRRFDIRIVLGYLIPLAIMVAICVLALARLSEVSRTVDNLTRQVEADMNVSHQIAAGILSARFYAGQYFSLRQQEDLDHFDAEFNALQTLFNQMDQVTPEHAVLLKAIQKDVQAYGEAFDQAAALIESQNQTQSNVLDVQALLLDNKLTALRIYVNSSNNPLLFLSFGNAQSYSQTLRLNTLKYLANGDERYTVLAAKNYQQTQEFLAALKTALEDEIQRSNATAAAAAVEAYYQGLLAVQSDTAQLRRLFNDQLAVLEPKISQAAAEIEAGIVAQSQHQNASAKAVVRQTRWGLLAATLLAVLIGLLLGFSFARRITAHLRRVMLASQQIANTDLSALTDQMKALARGDVRLSLTVTARPLQVTREDEIGQMALAFNQIVTRLYEAELAFTQMSAYLQEMAAAAQSVARGDLNAVVHPRSADDVVSNAILDMLANLRQAHQHSQQQLARLATLRAIDMMITTNQDIPTTLQFLLAEACRHFAIEAGAIYQVEHASGRVIPISQIGSPPSQAGDLAEACTRQTPPPTSASSLIQAQVETTPLDGWPTVYNLPLVAQDSIVGVFQLFQRTPRSPDSETQHFLEMLAGQAAIAIANTDLLHSLEERVSTRTHDLEAAHRFLETMMTSNPAAIVVVDTEHRVIDWNPAAEKLFGYTRQEALGCPINDLVASPELRAEADTMDTKSEQGFVRLLTHRKRKDGSLVDVEVLGNSVWVDDQRVASLAIYHDITELQQARQAAEQAAQAKSAFLATMSHEIRTPMNGVIGMTSLLLDTRLTPEQHEFVETIRQSGDALLAIINDILDYSKIEAGRLDLEDQPFALNDCLESALDLVTQTAATKEIELAYLVAPEVPLAIYGDASRLRQILVNLLGNALKFTEHGEVVVNVDVIPEQHAASTSADQTLRLHFAVSDTGIGIPTEHLERLFQAFSQVDVSTSRKYGGTGLGLAICKRLVNLMGGTIWAESTGIRGEGSTFHFTIQTCSASDWLSPDRSEPLPNLAGRQVLIVDDNATNRQVLTRMVLAWGMTPCLAASSREALAQLDRSTSFDLAILDIQMPEMDGIELATIIRQRPNGTHLPLVFLTSLGRRDELPPGIDAAAYLYKPIKTSVLYNALVMALSSHPTQTDRILPAQDFLDESFAREHPLRILLAEDHLVNQKVALHTLDRLGYRADVAANGLEVLQAFERQTYDLVLMDIQMPEMDGVETTRRLRAELPAERQPFIVALTANVLPGDREHYLEAGMNDFLGKPLVIRQLQRVIESCTPTEAPETVDAALTLSLFSGPFTSQNKDDGAPLVYSQLSPAVEVGCINEYFPDWHEDPESFKHMVTLLIQDTHERLQSLRETVARQDMDQTWRSAHAIKGASLTFGALRFSMLCKELEVLGKSGQVDSAANKLTEIEAEFQRVEIELTRLIGKEV